MARVQPKPSAYAETAQQAAEIAALERMLHLSAGTSSLSEAVCNSPALRDYLIQRICHSHPGVAVVALPEGTVDVYGETKRQLENQTPNAVFVTDIEKSVKSQDKEHRTLRSLNASRDLWAGRFPCPVVFWMPEYVAAMFPIEAADFWRYRSHRFEFVPEPLSQNSNPDGRPTWDYVSAGSLDKDQKQFRIAELEQRITEVGEPVPLELRRHSVAWIRELVYCHLMLGESDTALRILYDILLPLTNSMPEEVGRLAANADIADLLFLRGDLKEALRIHRDFVLPGYQSAGNELNCAITKGKIADILYYRGELKEALRMIEEEVLPVFKKLNDPRSTAIALGKVADVVQEYGDLDRALRIRQEEELPIYERSGDVRGCAITRGKIAGILYQRGELDEALKLRQEELAVYESLGDEWAGAWAMAQVAKILRHQGETREVLDILLDAVLPAFRRFGDRRGQAVALGRIAEVLSASGELDEALRLMDEELTVYEAIGDTRSFVTCKCNIAHILQQRHGPGDSLRAKELLGEALSAAKSLQLPELDEIHSLWEQSQHPLNESNSNSKPGGHF